LNGFIVFIQRTNNGTFKRPDDSVMRAKKTILVPSDDKSSKIKLLSLLFEGTKLERMKTIYKL
jgi:hypothetical protein